MELIDINKSVEVVKNYNPTYSHFYHSGRTIYEQACYSVFTYGCLDYFSAILCTDPKYFDEEYTLWLLNESAMASAFHTKTMEDYAKYGFVFNVDSYDNYLAAAGQLLRMQGEFELGDDIRLLRKHGASNAEIAAFLSLFRVYQVDNVNKNMRNSNHHPFRPWSRIDVFLQGRVLNKGIPYLSKNKDKYHRASSSSCFAHYERKDEFIEYGSKEGIYAHFSDEPLQMTGFMGKLIIKMDKRDIDSCLELFRKYFNHPTEGGEKVA